MCHPNCCLEPDDEPIDDEPSFIEKLPADILIEIFQMTTKSTQDTDKPTTPLFFGGICKYWREVVWSTPLLWSTVSVKLSTKPSQVDLLGEWLLRAQSSPLSIYLSSRAYEWLPRRLRDVFFKVLKLLVARAAFWQTVDCFLLDDDECRDVLQDQEFPLLSLLTIRSLSKKTPKLPMIPILVPRLVHLELPGYDLMDCVLTGFPLEQLVSFRTQESRISTSQCLVVLLCARALKECYLDLILFRCDNHPYHTLHTDLELLHVKGTEPILFFDNLTLPNLRVLSLHHIASFSGSPTRAIISLVSRSSCQLEQLHIAQDRLPNDDDMIALLEAIPSLTDLNLTFTNPYLPSGLSDELVSRLRPSQHWSYLLPRLTSLQYQGPVPCDKRLLVNMLSEGWHHVSGMSERLIRAKVVGVNKSEDFPQDIRADIDLLVSEGMQLEM